MENSHQVRKIRLTDVHHGDQIVWPGSHRMSDDTGPQLNVGLGLAKAERLARRGEIVTVTAAPTVVEHFRASKGYRISVGLDGTVYEASSNQYAYVIEATS